MSIGLLLITHNTIGSALLESATKMLGICPLLTETLAVSSDSNPDELRAQARGMVEALNQGDGVLILTDMYGSTPSNVAMSVFKEGEIEVVTGVNLPMLVRVLNYCHLDLEHLSAKAVSGGCEGIILTDEESI